MATASHDWTGSSAQRKNTAPCRYPGAKPTPKPTEFFVPAGTPALVKRAGDRHWRRHETTKDLVFDKPYGKNPSYRKPVVYVTFFREGYLLCVKRTRIQERAQQEATD